MKSTHFISLLLLNYSLILAQASVSSDSLKMHETKHYFYHGQKYGSESQFGPINVFLNVGMMLAGRFNYSDHIFDIHYKTQFRNVIHSITHPNETLKKEGKWAFFQDEVIPFAGGRGAWSPNYTLHMIGEGLVYRKLAEKYQHDGVLFPRTLAALSVTAAQLMNETIENGVERHQNTDALADFWFNLTGITLFTFDPIAKLFTGNIQVNYWPGQPVFTLNDYALINHMEMYAWKIYIGSWTSKRLFIGSGLPSAIGISSPQNKKNTYTYVMGLNAGDAGKSYVQEKERKNAQLPEDSPDKLTSIPMSTMYPMLGWFWDKKESLMLRVLFGYSSTLHLDINAYPGVFHIGDYPIGGYLLATGFESISMGLSCSIAIVPGYRYKE